MLSDKEASLFASMKAKAYREVEELIAEQKRQITNYNRQLVEERMQYQDLKESAEKCLVEKDKVIAALQESLLKAEAHAERFKERAETAEAWGLQLENENTQMTEKINEMLGLAQDVVDGNWERLKQWGKYFHDNGMTPTDICRRPRMGH